MRHGHAGCGDFHIPKSRTKFWEKKIYGNIARDRRTLASLHLAGWKTVVIWACEMKTLPAKAALYSRLPALIELEPAIYTFRRDHPVPMAAEDSKDYRPR